MKETINLILTKFTDETLSISIGLMGLLFVILIAYWIYYRRKFNELKHQIPAQVVKNYLDSIIQNSSALKSSLFRGGGLDIEDGIPSVVPTSELKGTPVQVSSASSEELNQKNAEIAALKVSISDKDKTITELESKLGEASSGAPAPDNSEEINSLKTKISELEAALAAAGSDSGGSDDGELSKQLAEVTQERDQLKEKLQEYEIIEEDLANLKRLQQENEQLKKALEAGGGSIPEAEAPAPEAEEADPLPVEEPAAENEPDPLPVDEPDALPVEEPDSLPVEEPEALPVEEAAAEADEMGVPSNEGEQKSAEELLSEFEKMLG